MGHVPLNLSSPTADRWRLLRGTVPLDAYTGHGGRAAALLGDR
jgi:hypothetical protein